MEANQVFRQARANADWYLVSYMKEVCNFTPAQSAILILEGYNNTESVIHWKFEDVRKWNIDKAKLTATRCVCSYVDRRIKCLQCLVYWIMYLRMHRNHFLLADFDHQ